MSIGGIAAAWRYAGGSWHHQVAACAVALAESGGRRYAISPSADYGLWQINAIHMGEYGLSWRNWMNPVANGHAAVGISHGGTNWAAWCTCWTNPYNNCGHGYLPWSQAVAVVAARRGATHATARTGTACRQTGTYSATP